jgi:hypothetical protein
MIGISRSDWRATACLIAAGLVLATYTITAALVRPNIGWDSGMGFYVMDSMRRGAPFNTYFVPTTSDIARDQQLFMTWWSPGQYVVPGIIEAVDVSLGLATVITAAAFGALGLSGWYFLYQAFGFSRSTAALATLTIACLPFFGAQFTTYPGGDVPLFGVAPWFTLLIWRFRELPWISIFVIFFGLIVMTFAKLTGVICAFASVTAAVLFSSTHSFPWISRETIRKALVAGSAFGLFFVLFYFYWLSHKSTPLNARSGFVFSNFLYYFAVSVNSTLWGPLSIGDVARDVLKAFDQSSPRTFAVAQCFLLPISVTGFVFIIKQSIHTHFEYTRFAAFMVTAYLAVMILIFAVGASVSDDERHFRFISLVLLVGLMHSLLTLNKVKLRQAALLFVVGMALYSGLFWVSQTRANLQSPMSARGFRQEYASPSLLEFIHDFDADASQEGRRLLVVTTWPSHGLEVTRSRVVFDMVAFEPADALQRKSYKGRVSRLAVVVSASFAKSGKAEEYLRAFADYSLASWETARFDCCIVYSQSH